MTTELGGEQAAIPAESTTAPPRRAQLVMGEPLGGSSSTSAAGGGPGGTTASGETAAEISNDELLVELPDSTTDLELTHLRLKTLRGLNLQRFTAVQRISLRQNLLSSLSYSTRPTVSGQTLCDSNSAGETSSLPTPNEDDSDLPVISSSAHSHAHTSTTKLVDDVDEDPNDDEDAAKKETEFEYDDSESRNDVLQVEEEAERQWPLRNLKELEEIDLYDNRLKSIRGLEGLSALTSLDLSFNLLRSLTPLVDESESSPFAYPVLTHLYLIQNKLSKIEGVQHRGTLVYLELGGNRIRTIENLPRSATLRSLFLGKNKITKMEGLDGLTGLTTLSIQSNRITKIEGLDALTELEELYLSHNGLTSIEGLKYNTKLTTLDVGNNQIAVVEPSEIASLVLLEEFWANDNALTSLPLLPPSSHPNLTTIYLEHNPIMKSLAGNYRRKVMMAMPQVGQIDAGFVGKRS